MEVIILATPLIVIGVGFYFLPVWMMFGLLALYLLGAAVTHGIACTIGEQNPNTKGDSFTGDFMLDFLTMAFWPLVVPLILASKLGEWLVAPRPLPVASDPEDTATAHYYEKGMMEVSLEAGALARDIVKAITVHAFENDADAERLLSAQTLSIARMIERRYGESKSQASGMNSHAKYDRPRSQPITASEHDAPVTPHKPKR